MLICSFFGLSQRRRTFSTESTFPIPSSFVKENSLSLREAVQYLELHYLLPISSLSAEMSGFPEKCDQPFSSSLVPAVWTTSRYVSRSVIVLRF